MKPNNPRAIDVPEPITVDIINVRIGIHGTPQQKESFFSTIFLLDTSNSVNVAIAIDDCVVSNEFIITHNS
ncbi:hypothetical protein BLOT_014164 [Blomia tropicalis]|nr:hypothetical protein BLOT_014164 [Blomia tropicalis]